MFYTARIATIGWLFWFKETILDYPTEINTRLFFDEYVEFIWEMLEDVPFDEDDDGSLVLGDNFFTWNAGDITRDELWHWFDERHSKGVHYLLYEKGSVKVTDYYALKVRIEFKNDDQTVIIDEALAYFTAETQGELISKVKDALQDDELLDYIETEYGLFVDKLIVSSIDFDEDWSLCEHGEFVITWNPGHINHLQMPEVTHVGNFIDNPITELHSYGGFARYIYSPSLIGIYNHAEQAGFEYLNELIESVKKSDVKSVVVSEFKDFEQVTNDIQIVFVPGAILDEYSNKSDYVDYTQAGLESLKAIAIDKDITIIVVHSRSLRSDYFNLVISLNKHDYNDNLYWDVSKNSLGQLGIFIPVNSNA